ncbi:MAG: DUF1501 domain-containing protein [Gemmataceae bacterium]
MFSLVDSQPSRGAHGRLQRREFLRVGSLALAGGLALPKLLAARAAAAEEAVPMVRDKSVVFLFLQGGPSQLETFDPKMSAPREYRTMTGEVQTKLPGVTFGGTFPQMASIADKLAIVRSFASGNGDHQDYLSVAGGNSLKVPMGTLYSRIAGTNHPTTGMPSNVLVAPEAVDAETRLGSNFETESLNKLVAASQNLGASYAYFDPSGGGELRRNLELQLPRSRFDDRRSLLRQLDTFRRSVESTRAIENATVFEQQAYDVIVNGISQAFDLSREDPRVVQRYDTARCFDNAEVQRWGDMRRSSNMLGKQMLMARRLCEAGCGFVTVVDAGWDMHSNENSPKHLGGMYWLGPQVDHAVTAFLEDVEARGLSDKILLVISGEMGRTPNINRGGGRDHWGDLTPLVLAGGGLKMGQVIGRSDDRGGRPTTERYTPNRLMATVMHTLFDVNQLRVAPNLPKNIVDTLGAVAPIRELF